MGDHHHRVRTRSYARFEQFGDPVLAARVIPFSESARHRAAFRAVPHGLHRLVKGNGTDSAVDSEGGILKARLTFTSDYPLLPPKMKFMTPMWHPNGQ
jgi:hypothetical protein